MRPWSPAGAPGRPGTAGAADAVRGGRIPAADRMRNVANLLLVRVTARSANWPCARPWEPDAATSSGRCSRNPAARRGRWRGRFAAGLASMELLRVLLPPELPRLDEIRIDGGVVAFAMVIAAAAGLLFGFCPPGARPR